MKLLPPDQFFPELTSSRLSVVAAALLDIRFETVKHMQHEFDDNYSRESAVFGRSRNMLIELCQCGQYEWLDLRKADMDITFTIGQVPCRFFRDDPMRPDKPGFFKRNQVDDLWVPDKNRPVMWRFVVEAASTEDDEDRVFFIGYNELQQKVSEWAYNSAGVTTHSIEQKAPAPARIPVAEVGLFDDDEDTQENLDSAGAPSAKEN